MTVCGLVLLRVGVGWHFLQEGVWKRENPSFSAAGFLRQSRGPLKDHFTRMIPDYDGYERLDGGKMSAKWDTLQKAYANHYRFEEDRRNKAKKTYDIYEGRLDEYLKENQEEIKKYLAGMKQLAEARGVPLSGEQPVVPDKAPAKEPPPAADKPALAAKAPEYGTTGDMPYLLKRQQDKETELRGQAKPWLDYIDTLDKNYRAELELLVDSETRARVKPYREPKPLLEEIDAATGLGIAAIGACLILGLFTRTASLAGALFLLSVVLAHPNYPGVFPAPHPSGGHPLFISKEVVEMLALVALALSPVGRWGGLDFFIHYGIIRPIFGRSRNHASEA